MRRNFNIAKNIQNGWMLSRFDLKFYLKRNELKFQNIKANLKILFISKLHFYFYKKSIINVKIILQV